MRLKDKINISINPGYWCNFRCAFCYLSEDQLSNRKTIETNELFKQLSLISSYREIEHIDLYGGEVALIKEDKLRAILDTIRFFYKKKMNVITNLSVLNPALNCQDIELSVSWDYFAREQYEKVYKNMLASENAFSVLILASQKLIEMTDLELDRMIAMLNCLPKLVSVEIKPFSQNQYHQQAVTFKQFEEFVKRWLLRSQTLKFDFVNTARLKNSLDRNYSSWSDNHIYIVPSGNLAVLEFNNQGEEYFEEMESFEQYLAWTESERTKVLSNSFCKDCEFLGTCLSEHLQVVHDLKDSCNGFKGLLTWYRDFSQSSSHLRLNER